MSIKGKIEKVYAQGNEHLVISSLNGRYYANWINKDGSHAFHNPINIASNKIIEGVKIQDNLLVISPATILSYNLKSKEVIALLPVKGNIIYSIDVKNKRVIYKYGKSDVPLVLNFNSKKPKVLLKKIPFVRKKDSINRVEVFNGNYSFVSRHEVIKIDSTGKVLSNLYFKPPSKVLKTIASVGAIALGTAFSKEVGKLNAELYKAGLKDVDDFSNELTTMMYFNELGSVELGMGVVAGSTVNDMVNKFEKETVYNPYSEIKKLWIHRDKLHTGIWGLRIIDLENIEELHQFEVSKDKNFNYSVDENSSIIISSNEKKIKFFKY